jgi:hypothetical protein
LFKEPVYPDYLSKHTKDILKGLLEKDPELRLGGNGFSEIKDHPFCAEIDWDEIYNKKVDPPILPSLSQSNFDSEYT